MYRWGVCFPRLHLACLLGRRFPNDSLLVCAYYFRGLWRDVIEVTPPPLPHTFRLECVGVVYVSAHICFVLSSLSLLGADGVLLLRLPLPFFPLCRLANFPDVCRLP